MHNWKQIIIQSALYWTDFAVLRERAKKPQIIVIHRIASQFPIHMCVVSNSKRIKQTNWASRQKEGHDDDDVVEIIEVRRAHSIELLLSHHIIISSQYYILLFIYVIYFLLWPMFLLHRGRPVYSTRTVIYYW